MDEGQSMEIDAPPTSPLTDIRKPLGVGLAVVVSSLLSSSLAY